MPDIALHIDGMTCGACVSRIDKALRAVAGVHDAAINLTTGIARVQGETTPDALVNAVSHAGYTAKILADTSAATLRQIDAAGQEHALHVRHRLIVGIAAGLPAVLLDMLHMYFLPEHSQPLAIALTAVIVTLATLVMFITGRPFFTGAWNALRHGSANMDVLVALGAGVSYVYSLILIAIACVATLKSSSPHAMFMIPHTEFHAAIAIVVLVTLGKYLEARAKRRAASAIAGLAQTSSPTASCRRPDGSFEEIPAEQIRIGDHLQILAHQQLPVDGVRIEGSGSLDLAVITGEPIPVELAEKLTEVDQHHILPGGAILSDGRILLRATSTAETSTVARILNLVNASQASKTHIQSLADRIAAVFVPIILALAVLNFLAWMLFTHNFNSALLTTIAAIVIACPCAMGLATPTAITVALGRAARLGILFTNAAALESASAVSTVLFDKTGTLTTGILQVTAVEPAKDCTLSPNDFLLLAASVEQFSEHPLARAVLAHAQLLGKLREPTSFRSIPGGGVKARFDDGHEYLIGSDRLMTESHLIPPTGGTGYRIHLAALTTARLLGTITFSDTLRPDAAAVITKIRAQGMQVGVISGDTPASVAETLKGIDFDLVRGNVRPEEKAAAVKSATGSGDGKRGHRGVAFIGDGVNDAPALAAADLGIAMAGGTDLAKTAGHVLLLSNQLTTVPALLNLSRSTLRIIRQNLFWAFFYNVAAIPLAMLGILTPGIAAGAMVLSSLTVVGNSLRLYRTPL